jgi:alpha-L-fucosidase
MQVRTPENLFQLYLESVGRGAGLLLNLPPDRRGLLHENDIRSLKEWKQLLDKAFAVNSAAHAKVKTDNYRGKSNIYAPDNITDGDKETYWATDDEVTKAYLEIDLQQMYKVSYVVVQEYIRLGQRVKNFNVEVWKDNAWIQVAQGTTIGYKRIAVLEPVETSKIRVNINDAKACPLISNVEVY